LEDPNPWNKNNNTKITHDKGTTKFAVDGYKYLIPSNAEITEMPFYYIKILLGVMPIFIFFLHPSPITNEVPINAIIKTIKFLIFIIHLNLPVDAIKDVNGNIPASLEFLIIFFTLCN
jgi:hypothetical protein